MSVTPPRRPLVLSLAAGLLLLQALAAFGYGVLEIGQIRSARAIVGVGVSVVMIVFGLILAAVARGVLRGRRWSRGPAVATQLILLPIAWSFRDPPTTWVAVVLGLVAVTVLVGVLHPQSTRVFVGPGEPGSNLPDPPGPDA